MLSIAKKPHYVAMSHIYLALYPGGISPQPSCMLSGKFKFLHTKRYLYIVYNPWFLRVIDSEAVVRPSLILPSSPTTLKLAWDVCIIIALAYWTGLTVTGLHYWRSTQ